MSDLEHLTFGFKYMRFSVILRHEA